MEEDRDEEMDFIPADDNMEEQSMLGNDMHEDDEDEDDDDENEDDFKKRSLEDDREMDENDFRSIFSSVPTLIKGLLRGILDNFE